MLLNERGVLPAYVVLLHEGFVVVVAVVGVGGEDVHQRELHHLGLCGRTQPFESEDDAVVFPVVEDFVLCVEPSPVEFLVAVAGLPFVTVEFVGLGLEAEDEQDV